MPIRDDEILRVIQPGDPEPRPELRTPELLRKFAGSRGKKGDWFDVWQRVDLRALNMYLEDTHDDGDVGQINFHILLNEHISLASPWLERTLHLLYRVPNKHLKLREQIDLVRDRMDSVSRRLLPSSTPPPVDMQLTYARKPSKSKDDGRIRPAPRAPIHIAVPMLELFNGEFTQKFSEYELSSVIADITGYTNTSKYRRHNLNPAQRAELVAILEQMIGRINGEKSGKVD
jgi:hypothetical protein